MFNLKFTLGLLFLSLSIIVFSGCGIKQQKKANQETTIQNAEALAEFQNEQKVLVEKARAELAEINKKITACNDKIHSKGGKLTEAQNKALDEFEKKRASINQRIHEIKNVKLENWQDFKSGFEADLNEARTDIDRIIAEL